MESCWLPLSALSRAGWNDDLLHLQTSEKPAGGLVLLSVLFSPLGLLQQVHVQQAFHVQCSLPRCAPAMAMSRSMGSYSQCLRWLAPLLCAAGQGGGAPGGVLGARRRCWLG